MQPDGSVTHWIHELRGGNAQAATRLWERFFARMKSVARSRTSPDVTGGVYDEEDVALSAFASFCRAMQDGRYPDLKGRDGLWQLLATFTLRKARDRARLGWADKRGGSDPEPGAPNETSLEQIPDPSLPPNLLALFNDQCRHLFSLLADPELESVALWKLEGYTNPEIAQRLGSTERTVQRMLALIRQIWEENST